MRSYPSTTGLFRLVLGATLLVSAIVGTLSPPVTLASAGSAAVSVAAAAPAASSLVDEQALRTWQVRDLQPPSDSTLPDWDVLVWDFAEINGVMYVGGRFQTVRKGAGTSEYNQPFLAAFDINTGDWISSFRPKINDGVYALAPSPDGKRLLVGGEFTSINGQPLTAGLAALDPFTGAPDPKWKAAITEQNGEGQVKEIVVDSVNNHVYVGGRFSHVENSGGSKSRRYNLARLSGSTGALDTSWNIPVTGGRIMAMDLSPNNANLYLGGFFTNVDWKPNTKWAAAINTSTAAVSALSDPIPADMTLYVFDVAATDKNVFFGTEEHQLWMFDQATLSLKANLMTLGHGGDPQTVYYDGDVVWMGGHHHGFIRILEDGRYPYPTQWVSALDATTAEPVEGWIARLGMKDGVFAITKDSTGKLWVGGDATSSGTVPVGGFAVFPPRSAGGPVNVARNKTATQSSTGLSGLADGLPEARCNRFRDLVGPASRAVDGKTGGGYHECSYSVTEAESAPWWQVDLGSTQDVDVVRIWNINGVWQSSQLADVRIAVSNNASALASTNLSTLRANPDVTVVTIDGPLRWFEEVAVGARGRYVKVFMNPASPTQLRLAEVEVLDISGISPPEVTNVSSLVDRGSEWTYFAKTTGPSSGWKNIAFGATGWPVGAGPLGFGDNDLATVTTTRVPTTYFRRNFNVTDPSTINGLNLELMVDDGAVAYLNGTEIGRLRMPAGTIYHSTQAAETVWGAAETAWTTLPVPSNLLVKGKNTLAVEVHNNWIGGGDLRFDAALQTVGKAVAYVYVDQVLIDGSTTWRYLDNGKNPGTGWTAIGFNDGAWASGKGQFGYGDGDEKTVIDEGPVPKRHITYWFRAPFTVDDPAAVGSLDLGLVRDDGAVVYLNGVEVMRSNMPGGSVNAETLASSYAWGSGESEFYRLTVPAKNLVKGKNVLAVEVHSADQGSQDISFDVELIGKAP